MYPVTCPRCKKQDTMPNAMLCADCSALAQMPTDDILADEPNEPLPADHAERCRKMAQDMANAERLLYRLANGDRDAAIQLQGLSEHKPYDGCQLVYSIEKLLHSVLG